MLDGCRSQVGYLSGGRLERHKLRWLGLPPTFIAPPQLGEGGRFDPCVVRKLYINEPVLGSGAVVELVRSLVDHSTHFFACNFRINSV